MDSADPGAGKHGNGQLGNHRQVDSNPVAFLDPVLLQHVSKLGHLVVHILVGEGLALTGIRFPD
ncbi:hypothetical protein ES705_35878 [subsurface metagenome]